MFQDGYRHVDTMCIPTVRIQTSGYSDEKHEKRNDKKNN